MKLRLVSSIAFAALTLAGAAASAHPRPEYAATAGIDFRAQLAPYGRWAAHPTYGEVFYPADRNAVPESCQHYGQWVQTSDDWAWVPGGEYHQAVQNPYYNDDYGAVRRAEYEARRAREEAERARAYEEWRRRSMYWRWRHRWDERHYGYGPEVRVRDHRDGWGRSY